MSIAYWCVVIAGLLPYLTVAIAKFQRGYDNANPREWLERQQGMRKRADFAHRNHFEAFPFFAAAVIMAHQLHGRQTWIDLLALAFIGARLAYTGFYLANLARPRSAAFGVGLLCVLALFGLAAGTPQIIGTASASSPPRRSSA